MKTQRSSRLPIGILAIGTTTAIATAVAQAEVITYDIVWESASSGTAIGSITIDTVLAPTTSGPVEFDFGGGGAFNDLSITFTGSDFSDGTYISLLHYQAVFWDIQGPLDFHSELISQGQLSEFSFISYADNAPNQAAGTPFGGLIEDANRGLGQVFNLISVTPQVPAPGALTLLGLSGFVASRRRR